MRGVRAVEGVIGALHGAPEYIYSKVYKFDKPPAATGAIDFRIPKTGPAEE